MRKPLFILTILLIAIKLPAQWHPGMSGDQATVHEGELGLSLGAAHYFGDINPRSQINRPKIAAGAFFRKQFGNYIAMRVSLHYAQLGYSDIYNTKNAFEQRRNLSFNSDIWELAVQGDFNFYKYVPGDQFYNFTPYITIGAGIFNYDPYAYYRGNKVFLRQLGTEGQGSGLYPERKTYGNMAYCFPLGVGIKYSLNEKVNLGFELTYRFTTTDYLDDVSTTYAPDAQPQFMPDGVTPTLWYAMQDRSNETGTPIGIKGRQRGYSKQNDAYVIAEFMISFNLTSYKCPTY